MARKKTTNTKMQELLKLKEEYQRRVQAEGQQILGELFKDFFTKHPEAAAVTWTQFTPHFNDGDACTFSVHDLELKLNENPVAGDSDDDEDSEYDFTDSEYHYGEACAARRLEEIASSEKDNSWYKGPRRPLTEGEKALVADFNELDSACHEVEDLLQQVLGDHIQVIATIDGFEVNDFEHD